MDNNEITLLYRQIEGLTDEQLEVQLEKEGVNFQTDTSGDFTMIGGSIFGGLFGGIFSGLSNMFFRSEEKDLPHYCISCARKYRKDIKVILKNNPNNTNYIIEIVHLLAPAIAQQYLGFSGMAIVGTITLLCRQGITKFIGE